MRAILATALAMVRFRDYGGRHHMGASSERSTTGNWSTSSTMHWTGNRRQRSGRGCAAPRLGEFENTMTTEQQIIRAKVGLLELANARGRPRHRSPRSAGHYARRVPGMGWPENSLGGVSVLISLRIAAASTRTLS
jgi:hypothetical protein